MNPEIWSFSINHVPWLPNKDILFPVTERPLGPNCRLFIKSRRRKDLFLQLGFDEASGDLAGQVGSTVSGWSHRSPIKYRHSRGVPTEQRPPLPMKEAHTCLTYIRKGLITWSAGPPQPVSTFVAGHMVAWAEEGEREKKQLGFLERLTPPDVVSTLGKKTSSCTGFCDFLCPGGRTQWQEVFRTQMSTPKEGEHSKEGFSTVHVPQINLLWKNTEWWLKAFLMYFCFCYSDVRGCVIDFPKVLKMCLLIEKQ